MSTEEDREALAHAIRKGSGASRYQSILLADQILPHLDGFHRTPAPASDVQALIDEARLYSNAYWPRESRGDINPSRMPGDNPNLARVLDRLADALETAGSTPQDTEWEYGAGYEADNGIEMRWFSIWSGAFTIREAAEHEVERFDDPQIRLVRRTRPGPWEPVPTEAVSE